MGSAAPWLYSCAFIIAVCLVHQTGAMFQSANFNSPPYGYQSSNVPKRGYPSTFGTESRYQNNPPQFGSSSGAYPVGPPPPPGEYAGGPPPPQSGYQGGPPPQQSGYPGGPPPQQSGYPGGPPPAQGGYIGGPPPPQGGYPGEAQSSYAVPSNGYEGGPPPRGGYQPQSAPTQNGYSNGQASQPTYQNEASQNGPALSSYQSAPLSGGYNEPPPPRGFPPTYRGGSQNTYPGESPRGYAPPNYPPSDGFPSRFPTKRYSGQVQYFTAPPPDPGRGLMPPPRRPYIPRGGPRQQQQPQPQLQQLQQQQQQQQQQQAFVPMPSTTTTPLPTSSTTTTGLPTTMAGEIEPPEYEGVTGTGGTTTPTTPTPTTTTVQNTTPPPPRPHRVHHHRPQVQQNQYPPRNQQAQRNHWHPPANARYPPPQHQQHQQQRYPQRAYPPQGQQPQRYPPPRYPPRPQPQARRRGYPETRPEATHQRYAAQAQPYNQPAQAYSQQRPYEPYKPAYQPRQVFREPIRSQQRTYESRAARMPAARPLPKPRQPQPSRPLPAASKSLRKEVRFHMPNHLIPKPPPTTTTSRPQRRPAVQPRNPPTPPQQQNYIGNAGLGRYGQQQYRWFPSEQRWSRYNTQARGKRSVRGSRGAGLEASKKPGISETPVLSSSVLGGIVGERLADPLVHDSPAATQLKLITMRRKSPLPDSTVHSKAPMQTEPSLSVTTGQAASEGIAGENIRREDTDVISFPNMRGIERVGIQVHKPSLEQGPSQAIMNGTEAKPTEYDNVEQLELPVSPVPLKPLNTYSFNWHKVATRNNARKHLHGRNDGIVVLSVA
ncbi:uncharacterized protein [Haliotis asinina]|uniref:uncharacterized protein isoform X2 n=1 Tax=Haliotis asinina TaxID=109174 RepID=UPI003531CDE1